jgi:hypothetical protein
MTGRATRGLGLIALTATSMLVAGCGQNKTAAGNAVEMRDMEVVDGSVNDDMTDLDAVRRNGIGVGNEMGNSARPVPPKPQAAEQPASDAEAVASE